MENISVKKESFLELRITWKVVLCFLENPNAVSFSVVWMLYSSSNLKHVLFFKWCKDTTDSKDLFKSEEDLEGGARGTPPFLAVTCFFVITLKSYKLLIEIKLIINNAPYIRLPKYYQNIFNIQSFVVWPTVIMLF